MPIGVIVNALAVFIGGILGAVLGDRLTDDFKEKINMIFGCCSMAMGISSIVLMQNMPAVVFSVIIGTAIGLAIHLGDAVNRGGMAMQSLVKRLPGIKSSSTSDSDAALLTIIVLFCASGTGIYGSLVAGMSGDHSILLAKSILDVFTAMIFACTLGPVVSLIAAPQLIIFLVLFYLGDVIMPFTTPSMAADFKACGGFLLIATGFRMLKLRMFPIADMLPAMVLVMPVSYFWTAVIIPALAALQ